jgi:dTMP kinase
MYILSMAFIAIEGADGAGKSTHAALLAEWLRAQGYEVAEFSFPQYGKPSAYFLERYLNGEYGALDSIAPYRAALFFALDRYDVAGDIRAALDAAKIVVTSRFVGSNMAIQGSKIHDAAERKTFYNQISELEYGLLNLPQPDLSVVLSVPAKIADRLIEERSRGSRKLHEAHLSQIQAYVHSFEELCDLHPKKFARFPLSEQGKLQSIAENQSRLRALITSTFALS